MTSESFMERELVILVHGFGAKRVVMWPLAVRLRSSGFNVRQWIYRSLFDSIDTHGSRLFDFLSTKIPATRRFHIVAHSMGCIVTRSALARGHLPNLGRLVFLAPPNTGSPAARIASMIVGRLVTPTVELSDTAGSYVNSLSTACHAETAVLAARWDLLVPISNTHLPTESAHATLNATHNSLLLSNVACRKSAMFLRTGRFGETASAL